MVLPEQSQFQSLHSLLVRYDRVIRACTTTYI